MLTEISPIEGNACNFNKESFGMDSSCAIEKLSVSLQSCEPFFVTDNDSAKISVLPEILGTEVLVGGLNSISIAETSEQIDNEGKEYVGFDGVFETKCPDGVSSSPQRKSRMNQKTQTRRPKKAAGRWRKADKKNPSLDPILLNVARRRRSNLCKRVRSSVWGLCITEVFEQNIGLDVNQSVHKKSQRRKGGQGIRKRTNNNQAGGSSERSNGKILVSTTGIRLKVKLGKVVNQCCFTNAVPVIGDDHAKCWRSDIEFPKLTDIATDKMDDTVSDAQLTDKNPESAVVMEKMSGKIGDNHHVIHCQPESEGLGVAVDNSYLDPGTSPDSEVINVIPDAQVGGEVQENLHDVLASSEAGVIVQCGRREKMRVGFNSSEASFSTTTGNFSGNTSSSEGLSREPLSLSLVTNFGVSSQTSKADNVGLVSSESQISKKLVQHTKTKGQKLSKGLNSRGASKGRSEGKGNACKQKGNLSQSANKSKIKEKADSEQIACKVESHPEIGDYTLDDHEHNGAKNKSTSEDMYNLEVVPTGVMEQCPPPRNAWVRCDDCYKWRRIQAALADSIEETNRRWICKDSSDKAYSDCSIRQEKSNAEINAELEISDASGEEDACDARLNSKRLEQKHSSVPQQSSWKLIKSNLFLHRSRKKQTIDEVMVCHCKPSLNGRRGCGDGCLNRMLNIECVQGTCPCGELCSNQQFQKHIYAQLRWFRCGKKGYGLQLLEDISRGQFLIEYVGEVLDMHAYEARQKEYARKCHKHFYFMTLNGSEVIDACAKGNLGRFINHSCDPNCRTEKWMVNGEVCIGLFAQRDIKKGEEVTFDYNYVRVFGAAAKKCVCGSSLCRGYLGGDPSKSEVIVQGDSDEEYPEPVMVHDNGEIDNSLENLISATSSFDGNATGIAETTVRDCDTEKPTTENQDAEILLKDKDGMDKSSVTVGNLEIATEIKKCKSEETVSLELECPDDIMSKTVSAVQQESSIAGETMKKSLCSVERLEATSTTEIITKSLSDTVETKMKSKSDKVEDSAKSHPFMKTSRSSSSVKKGKSQKNSVNVTKSQVVAHKPHLLPHKPKKLLEGSYNGRFEAVEEKLNELLDAEGGISKRKDAPRGYLKLLLLTAASGDSGNGEAIQSNRDLSMILDALLKTKSKGVLVDIINKNGLQMLHNIIKQYRWDFNKIPILRKLLKVLEYLGMREILTMEHITGGPPCPGMESFKESILTLTDHDDKQVHNIARNFRDMWIPRNLRKIFCTDRDDSRMEFHRGSNSHSFSASQTNLRDHSTRPVEARPMEARPMEATDGIKQVTAEKVPVDAAISEGCSASCSSGCTTNGVKTRKRKSRWDQPKEERIQPILPQISNSSQPEIGEVVLDQSSPGGLNSSSQQIDPNTADNGRQNIDEDLPPGFSSPCDFPPGFSPPCDVPPGFSAPCDVPPGFSNPCNPPLVSSSSSSSEVVIMGYPQERFNSRLSVSFGIPFPVVNQLGTQAETTESWVVAPGIPFLPFPPLPLYPRDRIDPVTIISQPVEKVVKESHFPPTYQSAQETPSTSGSIPPPPDIQTPGPNILQSFRGVSGSSSSLGTRYFRQQKVNNSRVATPWHRNRKGWGPARPDPRSGICSMGVGNAENEFMGPYGSEDRSNGVQSVCNTFYHQPQHQS